MDVFIGLDVSLASVSICVLGEKGKIVTEALVAFMRDLLKRHELAKALFEAVSRHLEDKGTLLHGGTIMDATLIATSPSTKNQAGRRDPEMSQSQKANPWDFGMKAHIGVDARIGPGSGLCAPPA